MKKNITYVLQKKHFHTFIAQACDVSVNTVNRVMKKAVEYQIYTRLDTSNGYGRCYIYQANKNPEWITWCLY